MNHKQPRPTASNVKTSWDPIADWYNGWVGKDGSLHHRKLAIPSVLELLDIQAGEHILDVGSGQGVLAPYIAQAHAQYTGVEANQRLLQYARKQHGQHGTFLFGDARKLSKLTAIHASMFDGAVFLLSIQDINPLQEVLQSVAWALRSGGRIVILMTHPCFRIPRQSGWGWQEERKLQYRRVDRYLTPLEVPLKAYTGQHKGTTTSFHRPLHEYVNNLANCGLVTDRMREITTYKSPRHGPRAKAEHLANQEIPLFLGLRARKI